MKRLISIVSIILLSINTYASHVMGGMIGVFQTNQDSTTIGLFLITDGQNPIPLPQTVMVEKWEMNSVGFYVQNGTITLTQGTVSLPFQGQVLTNYTSEYLDLDSNKYRFIYRNCCWPNVMNVPFPSQSAEFIINADYWHIPYNSTPYARVPFIINQQVGSRNTMGPLWGWNSFLVNPDNFLDNVSIEQTDLFAHYANGVFVPQNYTQLSMHVDNDSISWVPQNVGSYATGFEIKDMRNGVVIGVQRIQWTFRVVNSTVGIEENMMKDETVVAIFDWGGRFVGDKIESLPQGWYVVRYSDGSYEKLYVQQ